MNDAVDSIVPDGPMEPMGIGELGGHNRTIQVAVRRQDPVHADDATILGGEPPRQGEADHAVDAGNQDGAFGHIGAPNSKSLGISCDEIPQPTT